MFNAKKVKEELVTWLRNWFEENGKGCNAIVGISGGKDSSVVAALCVEALGKDRVVGVVMPNGYMPDYKFAERLIEHLNLSFTELNIGSAYSAIINSLGPLMTTRNGISSVAFGIYPTRQTEINLPARLRMCALYAVSQSFNGRVMNTCNLSEDYVGYSTRYGDSAGDVSPLGGLTVHEVIELGLELGLPEELVRKVPSDGLCGLTDEENFGFTYEVLDKYIRTGACDDENTKQLIDKLHKKNEFKLKPMPTFIPDLT